MATTPPPSTTSFTISSWKIDFHAFSTSEREYHDSHHIDTNSISPHNMSKQEGILSASVPLSAFYCGKALQSFHSETKLGARVALSDFTARTLSKLLPLTHDRVSIKTMGQAKHSNVGSVKQSSKSKRMRKLPKKKETEIPYVLERTDCLVVEHASVRYSDDSEGVLQFYLHVDFDCGLEVLQNTLSTALGSVLNQLKETLTRIECFQHIAVVVLQRQLRRMLQPPRRKAHDNHTTNKTDATDNSNSYLNAVAFIADGSILPRKSGRSHHPMSSPPAIPFKTPESDMLARTVEVDVGWWRRFLNEDGTINDGMGCDENNDMSSQNNKPTTVSIRGMIIPIGVTLIVGGGYHGKSTLLTALSIGIYDKTPYDGRERCVTHADALSVRAEDGRYVNTCNVSAFISNLPTGGNTMRFSTRDASGSTSQAANVVEGLECGGSALLVDEDVSAANFMARDGRMRAMIMDEPITPLLYRVNGLYLSKEHNVSTVVVVGGVGEWLDVADSVVLMKDYVAYDGLSKARSVSYQFSYNHVQYGGRGVVHRLPWEVKEGNLPNAANDNQRNEESPTLSPLRRKPQTSCMMTKFRNVAVHLLDSGSSRLWFYSDDNSTNSTSYDNDEDDGIVDMSKCSQLMGNTSEQLYGCGICILWLLGESMIHPDDDIYDLLQRLEAALDDGGMNKLMVSLVDSRDQNDSITSLSLSNLLSSNAVHDMWEDVGFAYRPRIHEVAMTLTRMRGLKFDILPNKPKPMDVLSEEEEQKKKMTALAEMWNNRRKK